MNETHEMLADETRQKLAAQSQSRQLQGEVQQANELREEQEVLVTKLEQDLQQVKQQLAEEKKKSEENAAVQLDEHRKRFQKELENMQKELEETNAARERAERAKKMFQQEVRVYNWTTVT